MSSDVDTSVVRLNILDVKAGAMMAVIGAVIALNALLVKVPPIDAAIYGLLLGATIWPAVIFVYRRPSPRLIRGRELALWLALWKVLAAIALCGMKMLTA